MGKGSPKGSTALGTAARGRCRSGRCVSTGHVARERKGRDANGGTRVRRSKGLDLRVPACLPPAPGQAPIWCWGRATNPWPPLLTTCHTPQAMEWDSCRKLTMPCSCRWPPGSSLCVRSWVSSSSGPQFPHSITRGMAKDHSSVMPRELPQSIVFDAEPPWAPRHFFAGPGPAAPFSPPPRLVPKCSCGWNQHLHS